MPSSTRVGGIPYIELHCHSAYSFLDGVSLPEELARAAGELGHTALALTDHNSRLRLDGAGPDRRRLRA